MQARAIAQLAIVFVAAALLPATAQTTDLHLGVATCASTTCHGAAKPASAGNILGNEYVTWSRHDPHAGGWATLKSERSRAMARRLGIGAA